MAQATIKYRSPAHNSELSPTDLEETEQNLDYDDEESTSNTDTSSNCSMSDDNSSDIEDEPVNSPSSPPSRKRSLSDEDDSSSSVPPKRPKVDEIEPVSTDSDEVEKDADVEEKSEPENTDAGEKSEDSSENFDVKQYVERNVNQLIEWSKKQQEKTDTENSGSEDGGENGEDIEELGFDEADEAASSADESVVDSEEDAKYVNPNPTSRKKRAKKANVVKTPKTTTKLPKPKGHPYLHDGLKWRDVKNLAPTDPKFKSNPKYAKLLDAMDKWITRLEKNSRAFRGIASAKNKSKSKTRFNTFIEWIESKVNNKNWPTSIAAMYRRQGHPIMDDLVSLVLVRYFGSLSHSLKTDKAEEIQMLGIHQPLIPVPEKVWEGFVANRIDAGSTEGKIAYSILYDYKNKYVDAGLLCPFGLSGKLPANDSVVAFIKKCNNSVISLLKIDELIMKDIMTKYGNEKIRQVAIAAVERDSMRVIISFQSFVKALKETFSLKSADIAEMMANVGILPDVLPKGETWMIKGTTNNALTVDYGSLEEIIVQTNISKFTIPNIKFKLEINNKDEHTYQITVFHKEKAHYITIEI